MTTALYRSGDIIALTIKPEEAAGMVCEDQQPNEKEVQVYRTNQPTPEPLRLEAILPWHGDGTCSQKL